MRLVIVGIGGIGSHLLLPLLQYLKNKQFYEDIVLVDGDHYEDKNRDRQIVPSIGTNKALATAQYYNDNGFNITSVSQFINQNNILSIIRNEDIVFLCVDNDATRKLIDDHIQTLHNVCLISGGNDLVDGNVQIVYKKDDVLYSPGLCELHPEISTPEDVNPDELSCEELSKSGVTQISIVNAGIADIMRRMFFGLITSGINYYETYVNFANGNIRNVRFENGKTLKIEIEENINNG